MLYSGGTRNNILTKCLIFIAYRNGYRSWASY
jgi:hypothetical protein